MCEGLEANVFIGLEALLVDSTNFNIYKAGGDTMVVVGNSLLIFAYCGLVVENQPHNC